MRDLSFDLHLHIDVRVRRMGLARLLMRAIGMARPLLRHTWTLALVRAVVCRVAIFEVRAGRDWSRICIDPSEVALI
ncbi:MAG: hypothetical protein ACE149_16575 [Armatimonadota bacterium]